MSVTMSLNKVIMSAFFRIVYYQGLEVLNVDQMESNFRVMLY